MVVGDHIKDEGLKEIYRACVLPGDLFPAMPACGLLGTPTYFIHMKATELLEPMYSVMHWALVRESFSKDLHSRILKMVW